MLKKLTIIITFILLVFSFTSADDVIWEFYTDGGVYTARSLPDLNGDDVDEVVCAQYYFDDGNKLYCVNGADGTEIWAKDDCKGTWGVNGLATIEDTNSSGYPDVILGTPGGYAPPGRCVILKEGSTGDTLWQWSAYQGGMSGGWVYSVNTIDDIDGDGIDDVIGGAGRGDYPYNGICACLHSAGDNAGEPIWYYKGADDAVMDVEAIDDIDSDGYQDVICGVGGSSYDPSIHAISGDSTGEVSSTIWSTTLDSDVWDLKVAPDVNDDGYQDVFLTCWGGGPNKTVCVSGLDGSIIWENTVSNYPVECDYHPDINWDGKPDMLYGDWGSSATARSGEDGSVLWSEYVGEDTWNVHPLDHLDYDGVVEVIAGSLNGKVASILSGGNGDSMWTSEVYGERIYDVRTMDDLDDDGLKDFVVCLQDQGGEYYHLIALTSYQSNIGIEFFYIKAISREEGMEIVWEVSDDEASFNIYRSENSPVDRINNSETELYPDEFIKLNDAPIQGEGRFHFLDRDVKPEQSYIWRVTSIEEGEFGEVYATFNSSTPTSHQLHQNYPNPFSDRTTIPFFIAGDEEVQCQMEVFDIQGRLINTIVSSDFSPGEQTVEWDCSSLSSGLYILKLMVGEETLTGSVVKTKD